MLRSGYDETSGVVVGRYLTKYKFRATDESKFYHVGSLVGCEQYFESDDAARDYAAKLTAEKGISVEIRAFD